MKVTKKSAGQYTIDLHGCTFTIEKLYGSKNWTLWNSIGTEINQVETKSGMLELMKTWSVQYTQEESTQEFCTYA